MHLHVEAMPDEPRTQAFLYGPLVLAALEGSDLTRQPVDPSSHLSFHAVQVILEARRHQEDIASGKQQPRHDENGAHVAQG